MKKKLQRLSMMFMLLMTAMAGGAATTASWDFENNIPAGIRESTNYQGVEADIESDVAGIFMHVDATSGKLYCVGRDNAQFNSGTILRIPVSSTKDVVTVKGYPGYSKYHYGTDTEISENTTTHTVTQAELKQGYTEVISDGGYIYGLSVVLNKELPAPDVTATWDFGNADVMAETIALSGSSGTVKAIEDNGILLTVESNGASFRNNGNNIQMRKGTVLKVPVKNAGDEVTVKGYPNYSYYTIGDNETEITNTSDNPSTTYAALNSDATQGYVVITSTNDNNYFYSISVVQKAPKAPVSLENEAVIATFPFDLGTEGQTANFGDADEYFLTSKVTYGSGLVLKDKSSAGGVTQTRFDPVDQNNSPDATNAIQFLIQPKHGFTFTPTKVSLKTTRFGTDNGLLDIAWTYSDGATTTLATEVKPNRNNGDPAFSLLEYELSDITAVEGACGLLINLYHLQNNKQIGFADIVLEGVLNGTEKEVPMLDSFTANGVKYTAEKVFEASGDKYVATIELSKSEEMISESNPVSEVSALAGEVGEITYEGDATQCVVTIPVSLAGITINYEATFVQKPDFTLTYLNTDGTPMGTQLVEKDSKIGEFAVDYTTAIAEEGYKVRGWFVKKSGGQKYTTEDVVTSDLTLYAVATEIEGPSPYKKYNFDLTSTTFYPEDHEAFETVGSGYWHDVQHGWAFNNGDRITLLVGEKATINVTNCLYSNANAELVFKNDAGEELGRITGKGETDGEIASYAYEGPEGKLHIDIVSGGAVYIHSIRIVNTSETNYENQGDWYFVKAGNASSLIEVIDVVSGINSSRDASRSYIFLPDGTYDLGETVLTAISGHNISLIGQSREGTIIKNAPDRLIEGIGTTATLVNSGQNLYMQDITLQNALDYYGAQSAGQAGGRAVCLQDRGDRVILKNVAMLSYQDTYYSQGTKQSYWEDCDVHGTVDFLCGGGDVRFVNTTLSLEPRNLNGTGGRTITAPTTTGDFGYVFDNCKVVDLANGKGDWNFGRTWQNNPIAVYLNTTLDNNAANTLVSSRWTQKGMNSRDPRIFGEYGTKNEAGEDITPASNIITSYGGQFQTILTAEQAAEFTYEKMFKENANAWDPASMTIQKDAPAASYANGELSWTGVEGAIAYAIFKNGEFVCIVTNGNTLAIEAADGDELSIRSANEMGGFGDAAIVTVENVAAISDTDTETLAPGEYESIACDRVLLKGLNTIVLPFETTIEEIGAQKVLKYDGSQERDGMLYLTFSSVTTLDANTPYAVFVDADTAIEQFEGKTVEAPTDLTVSDNEYCFVGTYTAFARGESPIVAGDLVAGEEEFVLANGGNAIKAYRAYMKKVGSSRASIAFRFDNEVVDGIEAVQLMERLSGTTYNLGGQQVNRTQKGIHIVDGKKIVVK